MKLTPAQIQNIVNTCCSPTDSQFKEWVIQLLAQLALADGNLLSVKTIGLVEVPVQIVNLQATLSAFNLYNDDTADVYVKFYDKATAPVVGTDIPVLTIAVPGGSSVSLSLTPNGKLFTNGIFIAATADANTTPPTANTVISNIFYTT